MADQMTELDIVVGSLITTRPDEDEEAYEEEREWLQDVQDLLREENIVVDLLAQPGTEVWEGGIESFYDLYQLRRIAAHLERGSDITSILGEVELDSEDVDELLADIWDDEATTKYPHLIKHQGNGGYYLPVDFAEPIWVESETEEGDEEMLELEEDNATSFGSSVGLLRELTELESALAPYKLNPGGPRAALEVLKTAAQQSVENSLPIILW